MGSVCDFKGDGKQYKATCELFIKMTNADNLIKT